ncbi:hypothetical protein, partial [Klebsiella pneumoniae]|uniref:hypothetical protein n=1 Tax=Klebsiella pneumoniae TaxID=573 RepID=UPI00358F1997
KDGNRDFSQREKDGQQLYENMFTIINSQASANPNGNGITAPCGQNGYKEQDRKQQVSERRWRQGKPPAPLVGV